MNTPELKYIPGFYWVKFRPNGRWDHIEFDGVAWMSEQLEGSDLYLIGPKIQEPLH